MNDWRARLYKIIFEAETPAGRAFDLVLLWLIVLSVLAVVLESIGYVNENFGAELRVLEWAFTVAFTLEYVLRLICVEKPWSYARSFYGIVDLLSILPTYLGLFLSGAHSLLVIRALRLLRVFRILKLTRFVREATVLKDALQASREKILVFLEAVILLTVITGTLMYLIEGEENGFTSIPRGIYWSIVTLTTVGFGDITPSTVLGQIVASVVMLLGYAVLAVPTGIVSAEMVQIGRHSVNTINCTHCSHEGHDPKAIYCKMCGEKLAT